ncbi:MAG TPA: sugar ABC transporter ATP-binding protein, partial [Coriobacteriia bacterium]
NQGLGVMFISSDLPEILGLSDRIYVMQNGRISGELPGPGATEEKVLALAMVDHLTRADAALQSAAPEEGSAG